MSVQFGIAIDFGTTRRRLDQHLDRHMRVVELAERLGFASLWAGETYARAPEGGFHLPSAFLVLAAVARHTGMKLGTGVTLLPAWQPLRLAYDSAVLDQLCGGRLVLGVGLGRAAFQRRFGLDPSSIGAYVDELLAALRSLWSGGDGFGGQYVRIEGGISPLPAQAGGPPLWVGGAIRRSAQRAAELGNGYYASSGYPLEVVARQARRYRAALERRGGAGDPGPVSVNRLTMVAETAEEARRAAEQYLGPILQVYARLGDFGRDEDLGRAEAGELLRRFGDSVCLVGTPDEVAARVQRYAEAGVTHIQARVAPGDMPPELAARTVRLLGEHVLPRFH